MHLSITLPAVSKPRRRTDILSRLRLLDLLYELLERKLILVVAPAGYGKTTLLIDFAHQKDVSACWYTVDRHDTNLARFVAHFVASISRIFPEFGALSNAAVESLERPGSEIESVITIIVNDLYEHIDQHFVIVLDDFHLITGIPEIEHFVSRFVTRVDDNCHLIIASRQEQPIPEFGLFLARGLAGRISLDDLAFTPSEIQSLSQAQNHSITVEQATELSTRMEGWITGILLTSSAALVEQNKFRPALRSKSDNLTSYWNSLLLDQPQSVQDFLLYSSLFEEFNAELCEAVLYPFLYTQNPDWDELLATVLKHNLFVTSTGEEGGWLRYHSLFRDYLNKRLCQGDPKATEIILRRLVAVYQDRKEWERAVSVCRRLNDCQLLADTIELAGPAMIKYGRFQTLAKWLEAVPAALLRNHPGLLSLQGSVVLMYSKYPQSLDLFNQADALLRSGDDAPRLIRNLVRRSTAFYFLSDYLSALKDAEEALELIGDCDHLPALKAQALKDRGISLRSLGRNTEGIQDLVSALDIYQATDDPPGVAELYVELGISYRAAGDLQAAQTAYSQAESFWRKVGNYHRLADLLNNLGVFYHHIGEYERAVETLDEGLKWARASGFARLEAFLLASLGDLYSEIQSQEDAKHVYEEALLIAHRIDNRFLLFYLNNALAGLARTASEYEKALFLIEQASRYARLNSKFEQGSIEVETARVALGKAEFSKAIQLLRSALHKFLEGNFLTEGVQTHLYLSFAYLLAGEQGIALEQVQLAFDNSPNIQDFHSLIAASRDAIPVLELAIKTPHLERQARFILENLRCLGDRLPTIRRKLRRNVSHLPPCQPKVVIRAFGDAHIDVEGRKITRNDWKSQTQKELLYYLLQHPRGVTKDTLLSLFWQDMDRHGSQLSNLLYKLRRLLGIDVVQHQDGRYFFNRALDYEYDVDLFMEAAERAEKAPDISVRIQSYEKMIRTYEGYYLLEADGPWVIPERERLHRKYLDAVNNLVDLYMTQADYRAGLDIYWQTLDRDPHREEIYCLAMRIYAAMGDRTNVDYQYQLCRQMLSKTFGIEPSDETRNLYKQLMN